jgi:recombinational DNA repair protein (RecF pathway)
MLPILKKTQKGLPKFVTSHLLVTLLILEGVSFNVNQAAKERKDVSH